MATKLSKEKKNQLILVGLITCMAMVGLGYGLIRWQFESLGVLGQKRTLADRKLADMLEAIRLRDRVEAQVLTAGRELEAQEDKMVVGDKATWLYNTLRTFKLSYKVDLPSFSTISEEQHTQLLPKFPYQEVTIKVEGSGRYHEIGRFIADFENAHPHIRVLNLEIWPAATGAQNDKEKLSFRMDVVALVKPSAT